MDRMMIYPGAIPLETDLLNTNKFAMTGLAKACAALFGSTTMVNGLSVVQTVVASLNVLVNPGELYSLQNIDGTAYSSLAADTTHQIVKQGISLDQVQLSCPAPGTGGFSINYLIQATFAEVDGTAVVLPYYNASNPSVAYSGPANAGTTNNTTRKGTITLSAKAGTAAATGTQTTPAPDAGYVGLYVVTVANGQTTIIAGNITQYAAAPLLSSAGLISGGIQGNYHCISAAGGTADAITGNYTPNIATLTNGMTLYVRAGSANATATPNFTPNSGVIAAKTIVKGAGSAVVAGDIAGAGHWLELQYDLALDKWVLQNPATGVNTSSFSKLLPFSCTQASNILTGAFAATTLDYRSATASTGTPVTQANGALTLAIPATSNLGMLLTAQSNRLVWLVAYNAGTPVLCVVNILGGNSLDETGFVSPTTISGASNSANVVYSASAVSANSPYRVVGFTDVVFTTGTGWSTPTLTQPIGGQALAALSSLGYGQTWQSVVGSRSYGTTYYNTTGKPIFVATGGTGTASGANLNATVNGVQVDLTQNNAASGSTSFWVRFLVPPGSSYSVAVTGITKTDWVELR